MLLGTMAFTWRHKTAVIASCAGTAVMIGFTPCEHPPMSVWLLLNSSAVKLIGCYLQDVDH